MNKLRALQMYLANNPFPPNIGEFSVNLILAAILGIILGFLYVKFGTSFSNRKTFSKNFPLLTMTTMFIITIVKSSLALSLGLVGALSIVRFRAAIKEPEELTFLFVAISIGLGLGAGQPVLTLIAFIIISLGIMLRYSVRLRDYGQNMLLSVVSNNPQALTMENIRGILEKTLSKCSLKRFDENKEMVEALFLVEFEQSGQLNSAKDELRKLDGSIKISFLDNKGVF